jgi:nitroimidazol reductase NimA-like FMN-containing flavoprotein (pyridoxamine 5'-phosphate oxidase superfamily)
MEEPITDHKIRRADRAISENEARAILQQGEYGVLSTASADGQPYGLPLNYCYVNDAIYFHCAAEGHKIENLKVNPRVSFTVVGKAQAVPDQFTSKYESVVAFGIAVEATGAERQNALIEMLNKYSPDRMKNGVEMIDKCRDRVRVYKVSIQTLTGKANR